MNKASEVTMILGESMALIASEAYDEISVLKDEALFDFNAWTMLHLGKLCKFLNFIMGPSVHTWKNY